MKFRGNFLLIGGADFEPQVHFIDADRHARLDRQLAIVMKHGKQEMYAQAYKLVFGVPATHAIPCWVPEALAAIAREYRGHNEDRIRGLAACILTNKPYGVNEGETKPDDGQPAPIDPVKPLPKKPSGGRVKKQGAFADLLQTA